MLDTGLSKADFILLKNIFNQYNDIEQVKLYGSRAKGNYKSYSDVDLAIIGSKVDRIQVGSILLDIDDSDFPYQVDLQNLNDINNVALQEHIERVGLIIY